MDATTWDGLPISSEPPYGAAIFVSRTGDRRRELFEATGLDVGIENRS